MILAFVLLFVFLLFGIGYAIGGLLVGTLFVVIGGGAYGAAFLIKTRGDIE